MKVAKLKYNEKNPRTITPEALEKLAESIKRDPEFMEIRPIVVDDDYIVLGGNRRLKAINQLGMDEIPDSWVVNASSLSEEKRRRFVLVDNAPSGMAGEWDIDILSENWDVPELEALGFDLEALGIAGGGNAGGGGLTDENEVPEPPDEPVAKLGDIWLLGEHRLMCGDSTDAEQVERLMGGQKADMVVTDPPYGVSYASKNAFLNAVDKGNRLQTEIANDHLDKKATQTMWREAFAVMGSVMDKGAALYCFMPQGGDQMMMMMMLMAAGIEPRHELIWVKNNHALGRTDYAYKHEPILYAWKAGGHKFYGDFQTSLLEFARPNKSDLHPTMKPVPLIERLITNSSLPGALLYEPFLGSGSTLIACEKTNRKCFGMELDEQYCDVIIKRWEEYTGKKAELQGG